MVENCCPTDHHLDHLICDDVFQINVDDLFNTIFSDSRFYRNFIAKRRTYDVRLGEWEEDEASKGKKIRNLHYTLSINYSIGPKSSQTKEVQTMHSESKPTERYLIDADCYNGGIPYSDNFHTTVRYCLRSISGNKTRMIVTCRINFTKNTSSFLKIFIDKTAVSGTRTNFNDFVQLLRKEVNSSITDEQHNPILRRRVRQQIKDRTSTITQSRNYEDSVSSSTRTYSAQSSEENSSDCSSYLLTILITTLLLISILNIFMYNQILTLENSMERLMATKLK